MKVHWTETAEEHLDTIYAYIAQDSATYASHGRPNHKKITTDRDASVIRPSSLGI